MSLIDALAKALADEQQEQHRQYLVNPSRYWFDLITRTLARPVPVADTVAVRKI